jgi:hypothetical protein
MFAEGKNEYREMLKIVNNKISPQSSHISNHKESKQEQMLTRKRMRRNLHALLVEM